MMLALGVVMVLGGAWLRLRAAGGELWLDEIWSLNTALGLDAWHHVFWKVVDDNNHPLNTLWLYLAGPEQSALVYRLHAIVFGALGIAITGWLAVRERDNHTILRLGVATALAATLYPLVHYGSEARGYAIMMASALVVFGLMENVANNADDRPAPTKWLLGVAGTVGVFSHLGILPIVFTLALAFLIHRWRAEAPAGAGRGVQALHQTVSLLAPLLAGVLLYFSAFVFGAFLNDGQFIFGGSTALCPDVGCFITALGEITYFSFGGVAQAAFPSDTTTLSVAFAGLYLLVFGGAVAALARAGHRRALPYGLIFLGVPLIFVIAGQPVFPHGRYFMGVIVFVPLLAADTVGTLANKGRVFGALGSMVIAAVVAVNLVGVARFLETGRGDTAAALAHMVAQNPTGPLVVGTDMPYQFRTVMEHTIKRFAPGRELVVFPTAEIASGQPEWLVTVTVKPEAMAPGFCIAGGNYVRESMHQYWGLSGSHWGVYRLRPEGC